MEPLQDSHSVGRMLEMKVISGIVIDFIRHRESTVTDQLGVL